MKKLAMLNVCLAIAVGQSTWAGTMGNDMYAINPGFIMGIDGGITYTDVTNLSLVPGIIDLVAPQMNSNIEDAASTSLSNYTGALGVFVGYKFPATPHLAFIPMVGYHYLWKPSFGVALEMNDTGTKVLTNIAFKAGHDLNIVDLTIQGNYRLNNGWNFFVQPGVAVVIDKVSLFITASEVNNGTFIGSKSSSASAFNVAFRPEISVGLGKMITDHLNLFAKYTYINGNDVEVLLPIITPNINMLSLGLSLEV